MPETFALNKPQHDDTQILYAMIEWDCVALLTAIIDTFDCTSDTEEPHIVEINAREVCKQITQPRYVPGEPMYSQIKGFLDYLTQGWATDEVLEKLIERGHIVEGYTSKDVYACIFDDVAYGWTFDLVREDNLLDYLRQGGHCYVFKTSIPWGKPKLFTKFDDDPDNPPSAKMLNIFSDAALSLEYGEPQLVWLLNEDKSGYSAFEWSDWWELDRCDHKTALETLNPIKTL